MNTPTHTERREEKKMKDSHIDNKIKRTDSIIDLPTMKKKHNNTHPKQPETENCLPGKTFSADKVLYVNVPDIHTNNEMCKYLNAAVQI